MSYELATIKLDCDTGVSIDELEQQEAEQSALAAYYQEYGFTRWYDEVGVGAGAGGKVKPAAAKIDANYESLLEQVHFEQWLQRLREAK